MSSEVGPSFSWLTAEFLCEITKTKHGIHNDAFIVESFQTSLAAAKGDNYLGTVFRLEVNVIFTKKKHHVVDYYIIKTTDGEVVSGSNAMAEEFQAYQIEMETYEIILPEFQKLWKSVGVDVQFGPRCYGLFRQPVEIIVLEDLKPEGFKVLDRHSVFNMDQVGKILQLLAQYHAASVVYVAKGGPLSETFNRGMFSKKFCGKNWGIHYNQLYKTFRKVLSNWDGFENIAAKINIHGDTIYESCCNAMQFNSHEFNVLNHGDTWVTNILFSENAHVTEDVRLIDFQFASWGSPAQDIWFLISTSIGIEDRINNFEKINHDYYTFLKDSLVTLMYSGNIPTEEELFQDVIKRGIIALGITTESFAAISIDKGMQIDFEVIKRNDQEGEEFRRKIFDNSKFINSTQKFLKFLDKKGIFDQKTQ